MISNCILKQVSVRQLGANLCNIDSTPLQRYQSEIIDHTNQLCIVGSLYPHHVVFTETNTQTQPASTARDDVSCQDNDENTAKVSSKNKLKRTLSHDKEEDSRPVKKKCKSDTVSADMSDGSGSDSESEKMRVVQEKLKRMKEMNMTSPKNNVESERSTKSDTGNGTSARPQTESSWLQKDTLLLYTSKGVTASNKVLVTIPSLFKERNCVLHPNQFWLSITECVMSISPLRLLKL